MKCSRPDLSEGYISEYGAFLISLLVFFSPNLWKGQVIQHQGQLFASSIFIMVCEIFICMALTVCNIIVGLVLCISVVSLLGGHVLLLTSIFVS